MKDWKPIAIALYGVTLGYFLGKALYALSAPLPWPYDTAISYALGILAGLFISFRILTPWQTKRSTKAIAAVILLGFVAAVGIELASLGLQTTRHSLILNELQSR
jgi:hypothetical protein